MKFIIEKVANMIFMTCDDIIFYSWDEEEFTERKLNNAMKKIHACYKGTVEFIKTF